MKLYKFSARFYTYRLLCVEADTEEEAWERANNAPLHEWEDKCEEEIDDLDLLDVT